ncbi:small gtp-binding protein domain containing protein [Stylonychia lemnae]|uniref:Small gtp-binding protein domain containing protein n=1 Tax=Stylonychia lemnae TaxID=5949 RepID=A0A078AJS7_STYLE|nr:small gtp-binding protein domain containing protein [Stylonychia lemnae]|eukprot:CDW82635.1 small gtp-binding protein domain containing protein [Stylonychia lemnae]
MNKKLDRNYYDILEIDRTAEDTAIKKAYKKAALIHHPDKGGSDEMFQQVQEAYQVLQDAVKRADYDKVTPSSIFSSINDYFQDLKKYNLKDGMKKTQGADSKGFAGKTQTKAQPEFSKHHTQEFDDKTKFSKQNTFVEIPQNLSTLGAKDLKVILESLGIKSDDCFEKNDLINRIKEYQENKKNKGASSKPEPHRRQSDFAQHTSSQGATGTSQNKENAKPKASASGAANQGPYSCMPIPEQVCFKIISIGNQEVGKSCLIKRYCEEKFVERYISTIGIDYGVKKLKIKGQPIAINFFDMSGNEDYKLIRTEFYEGASGAMMVFDLDNRDSFNSLIHWEDEMKKNGVDSARLKIVVCGNKSDSKGREINSKDAQKWAKNKGWEYFETSAQNGSNVSDAFLALFEMCYNQFLADKKQFGL